MENAKNVAIESCHDCGKEIEVDKGELIGGKMLEYDSERNRHDGPPAFESSHFSSDR